MKRILLISFIAFQFAQVNSQTITTIAGNGTVGYSGNGGAAVNALISHPNQLVFDQAGNLFIAEDYNHVIRKIDVLGNISTVAGNGTLGFSGDGFAATSAQLDRPCGIAVDATGNLYIADADNDRIRKVDNAGIISTIAGTGTNGFSGDGFAATSADIGFPSCIIVDAFGNVFFASQNGGYCVRKINTSGIISTIAGTGVSGYNGDGILAVNAQLTSPAAIYLDAAGNLFIGDFAGMRVRKVNTSGIISTIAGNGSAGSGGDGGPATNSQLFYPYGVAVDGAGNVFICESGNNKIRRIDSAGQISTFAGVGGLLGGYSGNGGPAVLAQLNHPSAVTLDGAGNVYIGDYENNAIRKITVPAMSVSQESYAGANIYPNPMTTQASIIFNEEQRNATVKIFDVLGKEIKTINFSGKELIIEKGGMNDGIYFVRFINTKGNVVDKVMVVR